MADIALLREPDGNMIRARRRLIVFQVTRHASRVRQVVIVIAVAQCTRHWGVQPGKRPTCLQMVERRWCPARSAVANLALLRKAAGDVVGAVRPLVVLQVA